MLLAGQATAAVPVEDMSTRDVRPEPAGIQAPGLVPKPGLASDATSTGQNTQLFYELQILQTEIQQLRGLVEDQAHEISRLRDLQRSQYLDIDRRLTEDGRSVSQLPRTTPDQPRAVTIEPRAPQQPVRDTTPDAHVLVQTGSGLTTDTQRPAPVVTEASGAVANPEPAPKTVENASTGTATSAPEVLAPSEKVAFDQAFELMKDQQFEQSITAYQGVVETFPDGSYAPESRYWLGELYLMSDRLEAARGSFASVVEVYPAHQKVPLSLYKLGVVNHRLGATPAALEYLDNVVTRYPDTPAAGLARTYAAELR